MSKLALLAQRAIAVAFPGVACEIMQEIAIRAVTTLLLQIISANLVGFLPRG